MGNCTSFRSSAPPTAQPTLQDHIERFKETAKTMNIDGLIQAIDQLFKSKLNLPSTSTPDTPRGSTDLIPNWTAASDSGVTFLKFLNEYTQNIGAKDDFFGSGHGQKVIEGILQQLGNLHWTVGGLSIIAYLLKKVEKMSENRWECLQLLKRMFDLAHDIKKLEGPVPGEEEKFKHGFVLIVQGCMSCASQLQSGKFFRFLKSSTDSQALNGLNEKITSFSGDLVRNTVINIQKYHNRYLPRVLPKYPYGAVGLQKPLEELIEKFDLQTTEVSSRVVVIYGFGGIGKTTLADALVYDVAKHLKDHTYTKVEMNQNPLKNDLKRMQKQILADCFPTYPPGKVRDCEDGRNQISEAINTTKRLVFIFIDNALRPEDLNELLPKDLNRLSPSRILITTRNLNVTDFFKENSIPYHHYAVPPLAREHALQILCNKPFHLNQIKDHEARIIGIASGIPLVLKILGRHLCKHMYKIEKCSILKALEDGEDVKEENLSERLVHFVYNTLEPSTQEAFLEICSFFNGWSHRYVEYVVGEDNVKSLTEAALVTSIPYEDLTDTWKRKISLIGESKLIVHDVIQAKGRHMGKSTRIKDLESLYIAARCQVQVIKGVELHSAEHIAIEKSLLSFPRNSLRTLILGDRINDHISMADCSNQKFNDLRCLRIGTSNPQFPINLEGLPGLSFYEGPIFKDFLNKLPQNLKCLFAVNNNSDEDECASLEESMCIQPVRNSSLEALELSDVENMRVMLDGRLHFDELKILLLSGWKKMEALPPQVYGLAALNKLILCDCASLKHVPESIANLKALTHLDLRRCHNLEEVCSNFGELMALRYLDFGHCFQLRKLPDSFGQLSALEYLTLDCCVSLEEMPGNFTELCSLKTLDLSGCMRLKELPSNFGLLTRLEDLWMYGVQELSRSLLTPSCKNWRIRY